MKGSCPLIKDRKGNPAPCIEHSCAWYTHVQGKHPQTGAPLDNWGCAMAFMPMLLTAGVQQTMHVGAEISAFRKETREGNEKMRTSVVAAAIVRPQIMRNVNGGSDDEPKLIGAPDA